VYDEWIPLRYRAFDFIHLTHEGHAMIAAALLPRVKLRRLLSNMELSARPARAKHRMIWSPREG
jgi:hypothetical protein